MAHVPIIDDDETVREVLRQQLEHEGYNVVDAPNDKIGVNLYHKKTADLVITDLIMPDKEGIETIIELKQIKS